MALHEGSVANKYQSDKATAKAKHKCITARGLAISA